ncbi:MAG: hypothetical protein QNK37_06165 [Acidobacteriota bacterium]|nr:hypothetical protein [Acidobacteriota bacterium]
MTDYVPLPDWPDPDQLMFRKVNRDWTLDELLTQEGWFPFSDVMKLLDVMGTSKHDQILGQREKLINIGQDPTVTMGLKQFGQRLWANMPVFSRWFRKNESIWLERIPRNWTLDNFLKQERGAVSLKRRLDGLDRGLKRNT